MFQHDHAHFKNFDALHNMIPFIQLKKVKTAIEVSLLKKLQGSASNLTRSITPR